MRHGCLFLALTGLLLGVPAVGFSQGEPPFTMLVWEAGQPLVLDSSGATIGSPAIATGVRPYPADLSPDRTRLVYGTDYGEVRVLDMLSNVSSHIAWAYYGSHALAWLPGNNQEFVARLDGYSYHKVNASTGAAELWEQRDGFGNRAGSTLRFSATGEQAVFGANFEGAGGMAIYTADVCEGDSTHHLCNVRAVSDPGAGSYSWADVSFHPGISADARTVAYILRRNWTEHWLAIKDVSTGRESLLVSWPSSEDAGAMVWGFVGSRHLVATGRSLTTPGSSAIFVCSVDAGSCDERRVFPGLYSLWPVILMPPVVAAAGADQAVNEGATVQLDATASVPSDAGLRWEQVAGPLVALNDPTSRTPSFVAPLLEGGVAGNQTITFRVTASAYGGERTDTVDITVKNVNHSPVADAGQPIAVAEGSVVTLSAAASYDPDGDRDLTYDWVQTAGPPVTLTSATGMQTSFVSPLLPGGTGSATLLTFTLVVSDTELSGHAEVTVLVEQVNHPPVVDAGPNQTRDEGALVSLSANATDPDSDPLTYLWVQQSGPTAALGTTTGTGLQFVAPWVSAGGATLVFRFHATDSGGLVGEGDVAVTVQNSGDAPACQLARPSDDVIWPPNHKLVPIRLTGLTDPGRSDVEVTFTGVTQDEPTNGLGDGDTGPDAVINRSELLVRAERAGLGNGRVYRIGFLAKDARGEQCSGVISVGVPHNARGTAVDDVGRFDSTKP